MSVTKLKCPRCSKPWILKRSTKFGKNNLMTGVCGCLVNERLLVSVDKPINPKFASLTNKQLADIFVDVIADELGIVIDDRKFNPSCPESIVSIDGFKPYPYQCDAVRLGEKANFNCLYEYQMGLGKTPISDIALALHADKMLPALIVCKGSIVWNHFKEAIRWNGGKRANIVQVPLDWMGQVITESQTDILPYFKLYITSYDMLRRLDPEDFKVCGIKTIILDECQKISNTRAKRSQSVRNFIEELGIQYKIALSGTPIKNHPVEFFSILNILYPQIFYSKEAFERDWVEYEWSSRKNKYVVKGMRNPEKFHELTKGFIFRLTRADVREQTGLKMDEAFRDFKYIDIDTDLRKQYKKAEDEFSDFFTGHELEGSKYSFSDYSHILALFARMRHLAALSTVSWAEDFVAEWLSSRVLSAEQLAENCILPEKERHLEPKLTLFTHHKDVAQYVLNVIANICDVEGYDWKPLYLPSGLTPDKQDEIQNAFNFGPARILVASTLGSGEGINLQHNCSDAVMLERQWNPSNEEQAESRFIRIGQKADKVTVTYPIVLGTIVEYFTELVEKKRHMLEEIRSGQSKAHKWDEQETVMALGQAIIAKRKGKRWTY